MMKDLVVAAIAAMEAVKKADPAAFDRNAILIYHELGIGDLLADDRVKDITNPLRDNIAIDGLLWRAVRGGELPGPEAAAS